jgi:hypothetical protein
MEMDCTLTLIEKDSPVGHGREAALCQERVSVTREESVNSHDNNTKREKRQR